MTTEQNSDGRGFLEGLEKYWVQLKAPRFYPVSSEKLLRVSPEHWIKYVFPTFLYAVHTVVSAFFFLMSAFTDRYPVEISIPVLLVSLSSFWIVQHWFFWFLLAESETHIIITSKRVLYVRTGLLWGEEMIEVAFDKMKTVEAHKTTLLQSILNYGTLQFEPMVKIKYVPHTGTIARLIQQSMGMI